MPRVRDESRYVDARIVGVGPTRLGGAHTPGPRVLRHPAPPPFQFLARGFETSARDGRKVSARRHGASINLPVFQVASKIFSERDCLGRD